ncbi:MAG: phosphate acyltransferase PlsX [Candidatus Sericytochromatia bacterium]
MDQLLIAVDVMGGDHAPDVPLQGAVLALERFADISLLLLGPRKLIEQTLAPAVLLHPRLQIQDTPDTIGMAEAPVKAVRDKPCSSLVQGVQAVAESRVQALVTAGNSGAAVVAATRMLKHLPGVQRPAMAVLFPGREGETVLLDVGSQVSCRPDYLLNFARLGASFARHTLGIPHPRVGLMNVGEEASKGHALARETHRLLAASELNFIGNLEGWDLPRNTADVAVCDGFTGNIVLKLAEGLGEFFLSICPPLAETPGTQRFNETEHGGSLVLGLDGMVVITHGRARPATLANAIGLARRTLLSRTLEQMQAEFLKGLNP